MNKKINNFLTIMFLGAGSLVVGASDHAQADTIQVSLVGMDATVTPLGRFSPDTSIREVKTAKLETGDYSFIELVLDGQILDPARTLFEIANGNKDLALTMVKKNYELTQFLSKYASVHGSIYDVGFEVRGNPDFTDDELMAEILKNILKRVDFPEMNVNEYFFIEKIREFCFIWPKKGNRSRVVLLGEWPPKEIVGKIQTWYSAYVPFSGNDCFAFKVFLPRGTKYPNAYPNYFYILVRKAGPDSENGDRPE